MDHRVVVPVFQWTWHLARDFDPDRHQHGLRITLPRGAAACRTAEPAPVPTLGTGHASSRSETCFCSHRADSPRGPASRHLPTMRRPRPLLRSQMDWKTNRRLHLLRLKPKDEESELKQEDVLEASSLFFKIDRVLVVLIP